MQGRLPLPAANRWLNWCGGYEESPVTDWGIACRLDSLFALADRIEARLAAAQKQVDALTPSLPPSPRLRRTGLARAFAGKLVPQDPADEPAAALLERIKRRNLPAGQR
jgi:type I restriction enzyme S subunit